MKTLRKLSYLWAIAIFALFTNCKKETPETVITDDQAIEVDTTSIPADTATSTTSNPAESMNGSNSNSGSSASTRSNDKDSQGKPLKGYSAPDGTDAENNDGDQYTKNDKTPMPSGSTSIK